MVLCLYNKHLSALGVEEMIPVNHRESGKAKVILS